MNSHLEETTREIPPIRRQSLFELGAIAQSLEAQIEAELHESEGEVTPRIAELMDEFLADTQLKIEEKLDGIGRLLRKWKTRIVYRKAEVKRYSDMAATDEKASDRLKERVQFFMEASGKNKIETNDFKFSISGNGGVLPLLINEEADPMNVPVEFQKPGFDNAAIRAHLESGGKLDFAELGERGKSLRIR